MTTLDARPQQRLTADQDTVRRHNLQAVARFVRRHEPSSRREIGDALRLNKATVSSLVTELVTMGLLEDAPREQAHGPGRPSTIVRVDRTKRVCIVAEILADSVRLEARSLALDLVTRRDLPLEPARTGAAETVPPLADAIVGMGARLRSSGRIPAAVMLAVPGLLDTSTGTIIASEPLDWTGVPLLDLLRRRRALRDLHLEMSRIASLAAIAEWRNVPQYNDLICLHGGSTGIGAAAVVGGTLLTGSRGRAGELLFPGHADPQTELGGAATLERLAAKPDRPDGRDADRLARALAGQLATLTALLDPSAIILAGYLAPLADSIRPTLIDMLHRHLAPRPFEDLNLIAGAYGPEASHIGGATLLTDRMFDLLGRSAG